MRRTSYGKEKEDGESNGKQPAAGSGGAGTAGRKKG
jgi:hypothetical protein